MFNQRKLEFDVVVVGGGSAGVAAAVGAANVGAKTLIVERNPYFGGAGTHSSVFSYCGFFAQAEPLQQVVGGVGAQFLAELSAIGPEIEPRRNPASGNVIVIADGEKSKYALDRLLLRAGVVPRLHCQVIGAQVQGNRVVEIECVDHAGRLTVSADAFVDASGEADLTTLAGGAVRFGDDEGQVQAGTLVMRIGGVARDVPIARELFTEAIQLGKQAGIDTLSKEKGMVLRLASGDILALFVDESVNGLDAASLTAAEMSARQQAWSYLDVFRRHVPGFESAYLIQTGPALGIRETRHVRGQYTLAGEDVLSGVRHLDAVARGGWPVEIHQPGAPAVYQQIRDKSYYDIPLRSLAVEGFSNLWCAGRIISCDAIAFASARVMGTAFATGHAAGVAAAQSTRFTHPDADLVRAELLRQGALV
ncbi:FAD-dependent oxidoreductase [Alicyclobacillus acidoterrestris]|uniref:FAD-dependent oxidoreductase n=1 Tax=Alicyclobacillus acidoterrestris (strain ATCC 49025 / DSM 3922 / CIP 106132 / NCIMB 13137 / GD3B) TaxID=1356854 RepID=T0D9J3_ALIAG|nr:FAD-dependent oxidoreductase [Alicyclobacillus acidoterrestris]EPZ48132.1 hypothetical protein N007_04570 [Alicyclobacillus acidoterrestris ATCC 49025]UNO48665.1 FAD-dependent oxidoreductase [Alicyclobacillus acidoterrestris]